MAIMPDAEYGLFLMGREEPEPGNEPKAGAPGVSAAPPRLKK